MNTKCINFRIRHKNKQPYFYCKCKNDIISLSDCKNCSDFILKRNKPINKMSVKLKKLESQRDKNLIKTGKCQYCNIYCLKLDAHEVYGGSNRRRSIENGFVILLCRKCHSDENIISQLRKTYQKEYEKTHTRADFIKLIGKSYLD